MKVMKLSAVCDCGISWSYSLTIYEIQVLTPLYKSPALNIYVSWSTFKLIA